MGKDKGGSGGTDFVGGGKIDNYAVVPSPNEGQFRVADTVTGQDVTGDHDQATAQQIADKYQGEPNPMRQDHSNYGAGKGGNTGLGDSTGGGTNYANDPNHNGGSSNSGYSPVDY